MFVFERALQDAVDETRAVRAEDPRDAHGEVFVRNVEERDLTGALRCAIDADRLRGIVLHIGCLFCAVEDVIGADVDHAPAACGGDPGQRLHGMTVDAMRQLRLALAQVHIRERGAVHQHVESERHQCRAQLLVVPEIEVRACESRHVFPCRAPLADERGPEATATPEDGDARPAHDFFSSGSHQSRLRTYHSIVSRMPSSCRCSGFHWRSRCAFDESIA